MKNLKKKLIRDARRFIEKRFKKISDNKFPYHNLQHTLNVVKAARKISRNYDLKKFERVILLVSAWFHDVGFLEGTSRHEERGVTLVEEFLCEHKVDVELIPLFEHAILATRLPQTPSNLVEEILCDADLYHLGTPDFFRNSKSLRKESQLLSGRAISKEEWVDINIVLLKTHRFFTDYTRKALGKRLKKNLNKLVVQKKELRRREN